MMLFNKSAVILKFNLIQPHVLLVYCTRIIQSNYWHIQLYSITTTSTTATTTTSTTATTSTTTTVAYFVLHIN